MKSHWLKKCESTAAFKLRTLRNLDQLASNEKTDTEIDVQ